MMDLATLKGLNPHIDIEPVTDETFNDFGKVLRGYDFTEVIDYMFRETAIPKEGNIYFPSVAAMEKLKMIAVVEKTLFGEMPCEAGYCNGVNSSLNGLEYHKSSEVNVAVTDLILLLGKVRDVVNNTYDSSKVQAFYVAKGEAIEIYGTTLHFAPCKVQDDGFKCVVILPAHTNTPLEKINTEGEGEDRLLFMKNKWLIAHPERQVLVDKGAFPGIRGENITIRIK